jgi:hypothetical protein
MILLALHSQQIACRVVDPCAENARRHRYRLPLCRTSQLPARTFTWWQTEIPRVFEYKHLGVTITPDGRQDTHIKQVIAQGNARVLRMGKLLRDKHLSVRVTRMLILTALRPLLEYGAEVLVPTREHARALESVQLRLLV